MNATKIVINYKLVFHSERLSYQSLSINYCGYLERETTVRRELIAVSTICNATPGVFRQTNKGDGFIEPRGFRHNGNTTPSSSDPSVDFLIITN